LTLPDDLDYIMRPVLAGMVTMGEIRAKLVDLADIALMNDALLIRAENEYRAMEASRQNG
jgi:hypothetical protein